MPKRKGRGARPQVASEEPPAPRSVLRESRENSLAFREQVAERAGNLCEYCQTPEAASFARHEIDHVIPLKHGGNTTLDNLAFACTLCNRRKGSDLSAFDPTTAQITPLFHPRRENWYEHFQMHAGELIALTPSARATIHLLRLNHPHRVKERRIRMGWVWTRDNLEGDQT